MKWSGWIRGHYFEAFDTTLNRELPRWLINNHLPQNNGKWPFTKPGVAFVSDKGEVVTPEVICRIGIAVHMIRAHYSRNPRSPFA